MATRISDIQVFFLILTTFIFVGGLVGNLFVATIIIRRKRMRTVTNWFVFNLSICDLIIVLIVIPYNTIVPYLDWPFGTFWCRYIGPILEHFAGVCVLTHTCLSLARYIVLRSATSGFQISLNHVRVTIALVWIIPFVTMSVTAMDGVMADSKLVLLPNGFTTCHFQLRGPMKIAYRFLTFSLTYIIPMIVTGFSYYKIHRMVDQSMKNLNGHISQKALQMRRTKSRRMNRAFMTMYVLFGLTTLPIQMLYIIDTLGYIPTNSASQIAHQIFVALFYGQVVTNPLVLFYMGEEYRKEIYRLPVCICRPKLRRLSTVTSFYAKMRSRRKSSSTALFNTSTRSNSSSFAMGVKKRMSAQSAQSERKSSFDMYAVPNSFTQDHPMLKQPEISHLEAANSEYLNCSSHNSDMDALPNGNTMILRDSLLSNKSEVSVEKDLDENPKDTLRNGNTVILRNSLLSHKSEVSVEKDLNENSENTSISIHTKTPDEVDITRPVDFKDIITSTPMPENAKTIRPTVLAERFSYPSDEGVELEAASTGEKTLSAYYDDGSLMYFYDSVLGRVSLTDDNGRETNI